LNPPQAAVNIVLNPMGNSSRLEGEPSGYENIAQMLTPPTPPFETDASRHIVFRRDFGPVASQEGVELRLRFGVRVFITLEGSVMVENGIIRMSANPKTNSCALEHPNGRIFKASEHIDVVAFDGFQRNDMV
jgi:hypothetical protein